VSGLAPRALEDSVRPRRLSDVVVRPLNFTVRRTNDAVPLRYSFSLEAAIHSVGTS